MKRLIAMATLGLALSFSSVSLASDYMSLYTKPVAKSEVKNEIRGGNPGTRRSVCICLWCSDCKVVKDVGAIRELPLLSSFSSKNGVIKIRRTSC